eukprot:154269-Chlamydomonas_euryale.AAC.7
MRGARLVPCRSATLSDAIEELRLPSVDLLKVNVERAEEDVLMGIEPRHLRLIDKVLAFAREVRMVGAGICACGNAFLHGAFYADGHRPAAPARTKQSACHLPFHLHHIP